MYFLFCDYIGGTVDIAVHEKMDGQKLKELCRATGGACGGTSVDTEFLNVMKKLFGDEIATEFRTNEPESFLDLLRSFESIKRNIKTDSKGTINVQIPYVPLSQFCQLNYKESLEAHVDSSELKSSISVYKGHFRIDTKFIRDLFEQTLTNLESLISNTFEQDRVTDVSTIVLVGGFAECALVQDRVKSAFPNKRVIIPEECGLAVLKGAVMLGHNASFIALRVLPFTIGIQACKPYNQTLDHDREHVFLLKGKEYSRNLFHIIVKRDAEVEVDTEIVKEFSTSKPYQEFIKVNLYSTKENDITYVDDHECHFLGRSIIKVAKPSEKLQNVKVVFTFGNTEMSVSAYDPGDDDKYEGQLDLLTENNDDGNPDIIIDE